MKEQGEHEPARSKSPENPFAAGDEIVLPHICGFPGAYQRQETGQPAAMTSRSLGHRAPLLWLVLPLMGGLLLGQAWIPAASAWQLVPASFLVVIAWWARESRPDVWAGAIAGAMLLAGAADYGLQRARPAGWDGMPPREARLEIQIEQLFPSRDRTKITGLGTVRAAQAPLAALTRQRLYFSLTRSRGAPDVIIRSATVSAVGLIELLPRRADPNTFEGFLTSTGANFRFTRGRVLAEVRPASAYQRFCARMAVRFHALLGEGIAQKRPPLAALLRAMMLGATQELSDEQRTLFLQSGTMHLFAISGLNIGIIAVAIESLLRLARLPLLFRFIAGSALLWLFVDITGGSPSAVRAFLMAVFVLTARVLRRPGNSFAALTASALAILTFTPLQVFGASFLMSYAIVAALFLLGLPLAEHWQERWALWRNLPPAAWQRWQKIAGNAWRSVLASLALGISATLVSLITGVEYFGLITPASLPLNLALIPAAGLATGAGFAALLFGLLGCHPAVELCNHAAALLLLGLEWIVRVSTQLPGSAVPARFIVPGLGLPILALTLVSLVAGYAVRWRAPWRWWPPFALAALTFALAVHYGD
jgi:competence protein ComEC